MNLIEESVILAYADDIVVLGNTKEEIVQTEKLFNASKLIGLYVNENKTKYTSMIISRNNQNANYL